MRFKPSIGAKKLLGMLLLYLLTPLLVVWLTIFVFRLFRIDWVDVALVFVAVVLIMFLYKRYFKRVKAEEQQVYPGQLGGEAIEEGGEEQIGEASEGEESEQEFAEEQAEEKEEESAEKKEEWREEEGEERGEEDGGEFAEGEETVVREKKKKQKKARKGKK